VSAHNRRPHDLAKERRHARIHIRIPPQPTYAVAEVQKTKLKNNDFAKERRHARIHIRVPPQPTYAVAEEEVHLEASAAIKERRHARIHI
jgi:hypothetical protein